MTVFQWQRGTPPKPGTGFADIAGATSQDYMQTVADEDMLLRVVTDTNGTSGPVGPIPHVVTSVSPFSSTLSGRRMTTHWSDGAAPKVSTDAQALAMEATHQYVVSTYGGQIGARDSLMPSVIQLRYGNPGFTRRNDLPDSWYLKDTQGRYIYDGQYTPGTWWLMDPTSTEAVTMTSFGEYHDYTASPARTVNGFADYLANAFLLQRTSDINNFGFTYDGLFYDDVAGSPNSRNLRGVAVRANASAADPATTSPLSETAWYAKTIGGMNKILTVIGGFRYANCLLGAHCYEDGCGGFWPNGTPIKFKWFYGLDAAHPDGPQVDAGMAEVWFNGIQSTEASFVQAVDMVGSVTAPSVFVARTTGWGAAPQTQYRLYSYAAFLLGNQGKGIYWPAFGNLESIDPLYQRNLGSPTGAYTKVSSGVYQRQYTNTLVTCNWNTKTGTIP